MPDPRVSFRVNSETWEKFGIYAESHKTNRSELLKGFIQKCLDSQDAITYSQDIGDSSSPPKSDTSIFNLEALLEAQQKSLERLALRVDQMWDFYQQARDCNLDQNSGSSPTLQQPQNLENQIIDSHPDPAIDQDSLASPISPETGDVDPDLQMVKKTVDRFLDARKNDRAYIRWVIGNHPESKRAKYFIDKITRQFLAQDRKRLTPLVTKVFPIYAPCFLVCEILDDKARFWTGRNLGEDWRESRFWEFQERAFSATKRLQTQLPESTIKTISIEELIKQGVISDGE